MRRGANFAGYPAPAAQTAVRQRVGYILREPRAIVLLRGPHESGCHPLPDRMTKVSEVAGVNALTQLELILPQLHEQGVERIMTAFDMDFMENPHVQGGYRTLWSHCFRMRVFAMAPICGIHATKVLMIMFGSTASSGNYLSEKGRFSFGCTVLFSFLRYRIFNVPTESQ